jgi:putative colanic acid biosynthesis acetyltransferase WcaF
MEIYRQRERWPGLGRFFTDRTARRRFVKYRLAPKLPMPWFLRFCYMYFIRGGIMDRRPGLTLCLLISTYELFIRAKYLELVRTSGNDPKDIGGLALAEGGNGQWIGSVSAASPPAAVAGQAAPPTAEAPRFGASGSEMVFTAAPPRRRTPSTMEPSPWKPMENIKRALWMMVRGSLFRFSFHNWYAWRRLLLKLFGANLGRGVRIRPTTLVEIPWNLTIGDDAIIGDYAILYSLGHITIGARTTISQYAHLCAGTHDHKSHRFPLLKPPIVVGQDAWIAADAFIAPGVTVGDRAVVGARATVVRDVPPDQIVVGPAATAIKERIFQD